LVSGGTVTGTKIIPTGGTATGNGMYLPATNEVAISTNGVEGMRLDSSGNLGLGVTPSATVAKLDIIANATGQANAAVQARAFAAGTGDGTTSVTVSRALNSTALAWANAYYLGYSHVWGVGGAAAASQAMTLNSSGSLVVGSTTANRAGADTGISVEGASTAILESNINASRAGFLYADLASTIVGEFRNLPLVFRTNDTERARITSGGDLLVGTTTSQDKLTVDGGITIQGAGLDFATSGTKSWQVVGNATDFYIGDQTLTRYAALSTITTFTAWTFVSDKRIKKDILPIQYGLKEILRLNPVKFKFIGEDQPNIGFIAQEIKQIVPEAVSGEEKEFDKNDSPEERARKTLSMSKEMLVPILVKAIQEQQALITDLRARVAALETK
jgi:hypothetical protein